MHSFEPWLAGFVLVALGAAAQAAPLPAQLQQQLDGIVKASKLRGAAVVLVGREQTQAGWWGEADEGQPLTPAHCLRAGSVSKTFTALLALRLAE
jgi:CubicO group peptidase (beta-lactamase class C family)